MQRKWVRSSSYQTVISAIVRARRNADMSQRELAAALGKPPSWIAKIEQGERRLDVVEFVAILRALGQNPGAVLHHLPLPKKLDI
jgi:transcriptional regulator with XRE-family HTH domain